MGSQRAWRVWVAAFLAVMMFHLPKGQAQAIGISISNQTAIVSWPETNYYYLLQSATNLLGTTPWVDVGTASPMSAIWASDGVLTVTNFGPANILFYQTNSSAARFYHLRSPGVVPLFSFGIFYDRLLEFSDSPSMVFNGAVHANGSIYTGPGSGAQQIFFQTVTTVGTISSPANAGYSSNYLSTPVTFDGNPPFITNTAAFVPLSGTNNQHFMIELPPFGESPNSVMGGLRYCNLADVVLIVSNTVSGTNPSVWLILQASYNGRIPGADATKTTAYLPNATPAYLATNSLLQLPFLSLTNIFTDQRESNANMFVTQIDVGQYANWLTTNVATTGKFASGPATILYVADRRNTGTNKLAVVRLVNGSQLPFNSGNGFTVASQNPLYVLGNYNTTIDGIHFDLTLGSTTNNYYVPAALVGDAITILSPNWQDSRSGFNFTLGNGTANTTINAALLVGNVPSTGTSASTFSGGVQNLPRLLEDWTSSTLVMNTSFVCLFSSQMATNQFQLPGIYFDPPTRLWGFDMNFLNSDRQPPGTPAYTLP